MAVLPSTSMGWLTVAAKVWPGVLIFDPTASSRTTVITVSAGTTTGLGRGGASAFGVDFADSESGADEFASVAEDCCWSAGFWQPPSKKMEPNAHRDTVAKRRFMHNLRWERATNEDTTKGHEVNLRVMNC